GAYVVAAALRRLLGQADAANLRVTVRAAGHVVVVDRPHFLAREALCDENPFGRADVRQLRMPRAFAEGDDVAYRRNALDAGPIILVHLDEAFLNLQAHLLRAKALDPRRAAGGDEQLIRFERLRLAVGQLRFRSDFVALHRCARYFRARQRRDALLAERARKLDGDRFVLDGHESREQLDERHLAAEAAEDRSELDADGAAAEDHDRPGHFL